MLADGFKFGVGFAIGIVALYWSVVCGAALVCAFGAWLEGWSYRRRQLRRERERARLP